MLRAWCVSCHDSSKMVWQLATLLCNSKKMKNGTATASAIWTGATVSAATLLSRQIDITTPTSWWPTSRGGWRGLTSGKKHCGSNKIIHSLSRPMFAFFSIYATVALTAIKQKCRCHCCCHPTAMTAEIPNQNYQCPPVWIVGLRYDRQLTAPVAEKCLYLHWLLCRVAEKEVFHLLPFDEWHWQQWFCDAAYIFDWRVEERLEICQMQVQWAYVVCSNLAK